jgi:hypothetical protein
MSFGDPQFHRAQSPERNLVLTCSPTPSLLRSTRVPWTLASLERSRSDSPRSDSPRIVRPASTFPNSFLTACGVDRFGPMPVCARQTPRCGAFDAPRAIRCRNGYRSDKRQGKPNFTIPDFPLCRRHFLDSASGHAIPAFTSRSSRTLNCLSNLTGHDRHNNRPENGVGEDSVSNIGQGPRSGRAATIKRGDLGCFRGTLIWTRR